MNESFPTVTGNSNIFNDNLHSFSIAYNRGISILNYYLFLEGKQLSSRFSLEDFLFLDTNNFQGRISHQLEAIPLKLVCLEKHNYNYLKASQDQREF